VGYSELKAHTQPLPIMTPRFILKPLTIADATPRYSAWLDEQADQGFIQAARSAHDIEHLQEFISIRADRDDVVFLGIFTKDGMHHIGNIKFEPVDPIRKFAILGILIGDSAWRGQGVGVEVIKHSVDWLHSERGIDEIVLGVDKDNLAAIRCYEKAGFSFEESDKLVLDGISRMTMVHHAGN
jgi:RimJ/RimL family protein N-acetyltransferase